MEESTDDDSGDEYVVENIKSKLKVCLAIRAVLIAPVDVLRMYAASSSASSQQWLRFRFRR